MTVALPKWEWATNWHLCGENRAVLLIKQISQPMAAWLPDRGMKSHFRTSIVATLNALLCNLIRVCLRQAPVRLAVAFNRTWYAKHRILVGQTVTSKTVKYAVGFLVAQGLIDLDRGRASGHKSFRRSASVWPTDKLRTLISAALLADDEITKTEVHSLQLRSDRENDASRALLSFEETTATLEMRDRLATINEVLKKADVGLRLNAMQRQQMRMHLERKTEMAERQRDSDAIHGRLISPLYRVFNVDFDHGGRFYGPAYQNVPRDYRPYLTIDGEPTVEVDYAAMHPTMLYAKLGLSLTTDPYPDLGSRDIVKATVNALLNAKGQSIRPVAGYDAESTGMKWEAFRKAVKAKIGPLAQFMGKGLGLELQRKDADIAEAVMMEFANRGIPILPLHDSFIVQSRYKGLLIRTMETEFKRVVRQPCKLKTKSLIEAQRKLALRGPLPRSWTIDRRWTGKDHSLCLALTPNSRLPLQQGRSR